MHANTWDDPVGVCAGGAPLMHHGRRRHLTVALLNTWPSRISACSLALTDGSSCSIGFASECARSSRLPRLRTTLSPVMYAAYRAWVSYSTRCIKQKSSRRPLNFHSTAPREALESVNVEQIGEHRLDSANATPVLRAPCRRIEELLRLHRACPGCRVVATTGERLTAYP